jgi:hypothetical protein
MYSYSATYTSGDNNYTGNTGACEPIAVGQPALTPGYWKNHLSRTEALIGAPANQPFFDGDFKISGTSSQIGKAVTAIFSNMNCSNSSPQNAIGCLVGQLLAAQLNVLNGAPLSISPTINTAQLFLGIGGIIHTVTYQGVTTGGILYTGPSATFKLTSNQRTVALDLANTLSAYNASGV